MITITDGVAGRRPGDRTRRPRRRRVSFRPETAGLNRFTRAAPVVMQVRGDCEIMLI